MQMIWQYILQKRYMLLFIMSIIIGYTLLFGGLFAENLVKHVPVAVCNLDGANDSRMLVQMLTESNEINVSFQPTSAEDAETLLKNEEIRAVIVIPNNFSRQLETVKSSNVQLLLNNSNTILGTVALNGVNEVISVYNNQILEQKIITAGVETLKAESPLITLSSRILYNSTGGYIDFFLPLLIMHSIQIAIVFVLAPMVCQKKLNLIQIGLKRSFQYIAIWTLAIFCIAIIDLILAAEIFSMQLHFSLTLFVILFAFILCMLAFALMIGIWITKPHICITATLFYIMPSIVFTGGMWPRSSMDNISFFLSYIMPLGYTAEPVRDLLLHSQTPLFKEALFGLGSLAMLFLILACLGLRFYERNRTYAEKYV